MTGINLIQKCTRTGLFARIAYWVRTFGTHEGKSAVSMFNLLAYHDMKLEMYMNDVEAFGASIGKAAGSEVKMIGQVVSCSSAWDGEK